MATNDCRINFGFPRHPKMKRLIKKLGFSGAWHAFTLLVWTAENRTKGSLEGLSDEDLELAVDWTGVQGSLIEVMATVRFLVGEESNRRWNDWDEHQPWVNGAAARSESAQYAALARHHGKLAAAKWRAGRNPESSCAAHADRIAEHTDRTEANCPDSVSASVTNSETTSGARASAFSSETVSAAKVLSEAGCPSAWATDPRLKTLIAEGAVEALADIARQHPGKPLNYVIQTYRGRLDEASAMPRPRASSAARSQPTAAEAMPRRLETQSEADANARAQWRDFGAVLAEKPAGQEAGL